MKFSYVAALFTMAIGLSASADQIFQFTITNGGPMPISPGILYVTKGDAALINVGQTATPGFVQLCQTGNPAARLNEIQAAGSELSAQQTIGPVMPGKSFQIQVGLSDLSQSIHFEAMYGETKDTCAAFTVTGKMLRGLNQDPQGLYAGKDEAVSTGMYPDPSVPMAGARSGDCAPNSTGVACLRMLAGGQGTGVVHYFTGYLPSVVNLLEQSFGAAQTQALLLPVSGAVRFEVKAVASGSSTIP